MAFDTFEHVLAFLATNSPFGCVSVPYGCTWMHMGAYKCMQMHTDACMTDAFGCLTDAWGRHSMEAPERLSQSPSRRASRPQTFNIYQQHELLIAQSQNKPMCMKLKTYLLRQPRSPATSHKTTKKCRPKNGPVGGWLVCIGLHILNVLALSQWIQKTFA